VYIVAWSTPVDDHTMVAVVDHGRLRGGAVPLQSLLARGYCEEWTGSADDERAILAAVPDECLPVEDIGALLVERALSGPIDAYRLLAKDDPPERLVEQAELERIAVAVLLFCLFGRLCDQGSNEGRDPWPLLDRAITSLQRKPRPGHVSLTDGAALFRQMLKTNYLSEDESFWEMLVRLISPHIGDGAPLQSPSALHGYLYSLASARNTLDTLTAI